MYLFFFSFAAYAFSVMLMNPLQIHGYEDLALFSLKSFIVLALNIEVFYSF